MRYRVGRQVKHGLPNRIPDFNQKDIEIDWARVRAGKIEALWNQNNIRLSLKLSDSKGRFLFETRPDIFPQGFLTEDEIRLWSIYYANKPRSKKRVRP